MSQPINIVDLDCSERVQSSEGIDPSQLTRSRIHFLVAQNHACIAQMQFADAKAAALMTLMGLVGLKGPVALMPLDLNDPLLIAIFALNSACLLGCIWAIIPRYPGPGLRKALYRTDRFAWPALASSDPEALGFPAFMREAQAGQLIHSMASTNQALSRILLRKFLVLRIAFFLAGGFLALMMVRLAGFLPAPPAG